MRGLAEPDAADREPEAREHDDRPERPVHDREEPVVEIGPRPPGGPAQHPRHDGVGNERQDQCRDDDRRRLDEWIRPERLDQALHARGYLQHHRRPPWNERRLSRIPRSRGSQAKARSFSWWLAR